MAEIKMSAAAMRKLEKGWQVPVDGSEADAVRAVEKQMRAGGLEPNRAGVKKLVREVRAGK